MRKTLPVLATVLGVATTVLAVSPAATAATSARVVRWVDGDTVVTTRGTVRLIGFDTPERGRCGFTAATNSARRLAPVGSVVRLGNPRSVRDQDRYGRKLRYVMRGTRDIGAAQIRRGAWARYDGRDGYQWHRKQAQYRRIDARVRNYCGYRVGASSGGTTSGPVSPAGRSCPSYAPIKGNRDSMIYHRPGQQYYGVTVPEQCFRTAAAAERAGYRAAKI
jgi:endonuclease YncB( thermonuclease family)